MFCPQCGTTQGEDVKFCKSCGANLYAVRQVVTTREREHPSSLAAERKRYNEIKAGVITSCVGLGIMIFLYFFMKGIALSGEVKPGEQEIISRIWLAGVIPFLVGLGVLFNGVIVSKKLVQLAGRERQQETGKLIEASGKDKEEVLLPSADRYGSDPLRPSVTEHTTRELKDSR